MPVQIDLPEGMVYCVHGDSSSIDVQYDGRGKPFVGGEKVVGKLGKYLETLYRP
jgi:hypothetical protein